MNPPRTSYGLRRVLAGLLALTAGVPFVSASVIGDFVSEGVPAGLPDAPGEAVSPARSLFIPTVDLTENLSTQIHSLAAAPPAASPETLRAQLRGALRVYSDRTPLNRARALLVHGLLVDVLSNSTAREMIGRHLGAEATRGLATLTGAHSEVTRAGLIPYAEELKEALAGAFAGNAAGLDKFFDAADRKIKYAPSLVAADGSAGPHNALRPHSEGTIRLSSLLERRYGPALMRFGGSITPDSFSGFTQFVEVHLRSHLDQAREWLRSGLISQTVYDLLAGAIRYHDDAYRFKFPRDVEDREAELKEIWTTIGFALGQGWRAAARRANETYVLLRNAFDGEYVAGQFEKSGVPTNAAQGLAMDYGTLVGTTLGHGSMSIVESARMLAHAGMVPRAALGFALLIGLHHPGFPITMVHGLAKGLAAKGESLQIEDRLLAPLLIRKGEELETADMALAEKNATAVRDSEALRVEVSRYAAGLIGIRPAEALKIADLIYLADRTTAARSNTPDARDFRMVDDKPSFTTYNVPGAKVGEIVKKYGLILTGIMPAANVKTWNDVQKFNVWAAFAKVLSSVVVETQAPVQSIRYALADRSLSMTGEDRRQFEALERMLLTESRREIDRTRAIQDSILQYIVSDRIAGFSGLSIDLDRDIALVHARAVEIGPDAGDYGTVSQLLSALVAMRTGGANQNTLAALARVPRPTPLRR